MYALVKSSLIDLETYGAGYGDRAQAGLKSVQRERLSEKTLKRDATV